MPKGLDPQEMIAAQQAGFRPCGMGPRVLRTETAGLAAWRSCRRCGVISGGVVMFESAELGHKVDKETFKTRCRSCAELLDVQYDMLKRRNFRWSS